MSLDSLNSSRTKARPIQLYHFAYGTGADEYYGYTDAEVTISFDTGDGHGTKSFVPLPIDRDSVKASGDMDNNAISISTTKDADVGSIFFGFPPSSIVVLTIWQGDLGTSEMAVTWAGRVTGVSRDGNEMTLSAEPVTTSMQRVGLRRNWQRGCPLPLYSQGLGLCNANEAAATITTTVTAVDSPFVTLTAGWDGSHSPADFLNGTFSWRVSGGPFHIRSVMKIVDDVVVLRLSGEATGLVVGQTVTLKLGCPHDRTGCTGLHNNIQNYGGDDWIPTVNPIGIKNNFY